MRRLDSSSTQPGPGDEGVGGIHGLLARTDNRLLTIGDSGAHAYYHADGSGNVTALINTNQARVAWYLYDPFGNILGQGGPLAEANLYRFSSKEFHLNSGLSYYLYRYYDPASQRWLRVDPLGQYGGLNTYAALGNAPVNNVDPFGLWHWPWSMPTWMDKNGGLHYGLPPSEWPKCSGGLREFFSNSSDDDAVG